MKLSIWSAILREITVSSFLNSSITCNSPLFSLWVTERTAFRNKKKELKDLDNHAYQAGSETSSNVVDALDSVDELETDLDQSKESMYKLSYVIRVSNASTTFELVSLPA